MVRRVLLNLLACGVGGVAGCANRSVVLPTGHLPPPVSGRDLGTSGALTPTRPTPAPAPDDKKRDDKKSDGGIRPAGHAEPPEPKTGDSKPGDSKPRDAKGSFDLPRGLPGADSPAVLPPPFSKDTPAAEREKGVRAAYPVLPPVSAATDAEWGANATPVSLADLQQFATEHSPVLKRATAAAAASYGLVVQAGLHPNPTVGYQSDQVQPRLAIPPGATFSGAGQQGGFVNQLIKTAGKLTLAQKVAGFDYLNALVAVRRSEVDVASAVRTQYFAVLVARQSVEVNRALAQLADEVYGIQLKQLAAGEAVAYEPLQLYAQAEQARNALGQAVATDRAAWKQLAAAVGRPDLPPAPLVGKADGTPPRFDPETVQARLLDRHTDLLTSRNTLAQANVNLILQRRLPIPDLTTNQYHQYDNAAQAYQYGLQIGIQLPLFDRNQGNIRSAQSQIGRAAADLVVTQNDLTGRLAEAFGRYQANVAIADRYREKILPNLAQAYRGIVRRYQVEPEKVGFNDIVVAQQNLAQALQSYLAALDAQWRAVVDVANVGQLDELYPETGK